MEYDLHIENNEAKFDDNSYYLLKVQLLMLVNDNHQSLLDSDDSLGSWEFIANFLPFVESFVSKNYLSDDMRKNALNYLNIVRFMDEDKTLNMNEYIEKMLKIDLINRMIVMINGQEKDNSLSYFRYEMYNRTNDKIYLNHFVLTDENILEERKELFESIAFDHFLLCTHDEQVSDKEFNKYLPQLLNIKKYYNSLSSILNEYPEQLLNDVFYERCLYILNNNLINNKVICKKASLEFIDIVEKLRSKVMKRKVL